MAVPLVINGVAYSFPNTADEEWGDNVTNWATAVTNNIIQKTGGNFVLTGDLNFGASFGLVSKYFKSRTNNLASDGVVRLANSDTIGWRNGANTADRLLGVTQNLLSFNGDPIRISVKDFGAKGDGSTDDTAAIQAAFDAAGNVDSLVGVVHFPTVRNQYIISDTITISGQQAIKILGDGPQESQIKFVGSNAVPMIFVDINQSAGVEIGNLALNNAGSATIGIQLNCSKYLLHDIYCVSTNGFSRAIVSDFTVGNYTYFGVLRDCYFIVSEAGKESPIGIELCEGHTKIVDRCMLSGFPKGISLTTGDYGGHMLGASIINTHVESFDGQSSPYPGSTDAVGIYADYVFGLNITGCNFQMNGSGSSAGGPQRAIVLKDINGAIISGCLFFRQAEANSAEISIASALCKGLVVEGNVFWRCFVAGIEVLNRNALYEIGMNAIPFTTTLIDDSGTPNWTSLTVVNGGGSVSYTLRFSWLGNRVFFTLNIIPTGGATTASARGTTKVNWPNMPTPVMLDTCYGTTDNADNLGTGLIYTDGHIYVPGWTATSFKVTITGSYLADFGA